MEPENHPFGKEKHLNQTFILGFHVNFQVCNRFLPNQNSNQTFFAAPRLHCIKQFKSREKTDGDGGSFFFFEVFHWFTAGDATMGYENHEI